mmetsp:Transcript_4883/g.14518  ORF Transcript_4883/g.14518 Transcript_4883/m.14518 type:complete len:254 (+) Transcript_4883:273-1034(+)
MPAGRRAACLPVCARRRRCSLAQRPTFWRGCNVRGFPEAYSARVRPASRFVSQRTHMSGETSLSKPQWPQRQRGHSARGDSSPRAGAVRSVASAAAASLQAEAAFSPPGSSAVLAVSSPSGGGGAGKLSGELSESSSALAAGAPATHASPGPAAPHAAGNASVPEEAWETSASALLSRVPAQSWVSAPSAATVARAPRAMAGDAAVSSAAFVPWSSCVWVLAGSSFVWAPAKVLTVIPFSAASLPSGRRCSET